MAPFRRASASACFALLLLSTTRLADAETYSASTDGSPYSLTEALEVAGAGDRIFLENGVYKESLITVGGGEEGNPLVIMGGRDAVINAENVDRYGFDVESGYMWHIAHWQSLDHVLVGALNLTTLVFKHRLYVFSRPQDCTAQTKKRIPAAAVICYCIVPPNGRNSTSLNELG